jgi:hypothetical protein
MKRGEQMTDYEKAVVMAFTGVCMLSADKFNIFQEYVEKIMGRPIYSHEMAYKEISDEIREKSKADFLRICEEDSDKKAEFVSKRKLKEAISKMEELKKEGNSFAECADECIEILREVII